MKKITLSGCLGRLLLTIILVMGVVWAFSQLFPRAYDTLEAKALGIKEDTLVTTIQKKDSIPKKNRKSIHTKNPKLSVKLEHEDKCYIVDDLKRNDPRLVDCVETLGESANGFLANLKVVEIPDNVDWIISDDYGKEIIEEVHRSWC
jgi:hypothetical protein